MMSIADKERSREFPSVTDVETACIAAARTKNLGHWSSRLNDLLTPDEKRRAHLLLNHVARSADGTTRENLRGVFVNDAPQSDTDTLDSQLRQLLKLPEDDGYLVTEADRIRFRSFLLRDFWKQEGSC